ncbi:MAG TPA: DUF2167 domain-containing protein [Caldimonas sp.]|jgi:uncharacterized membrane-anchored protein|nr:DUF2167 domain-containing protein [Caldimonas sp.]
MNRWHRRQAIAWTLAWAALGAQAQGASAPAASDGAREAIRQEVDRVKIVGPAEVVLIDQARLALPSARMWVPQPVAGRILEAMGNRPGPRLLGLIYPLGESEDWIVVAEYEPSGYVKDDDARDWNADDLLKSLKDGTAEANEERRKRGFADIEVTGWAEKPTYDAATHRLVWAALAAQAGQQSGPTIVNYNTYALGREGFISLNLLTDSSHLGADKKQARDLLGHLEFVSGKRYADFDSKTDHIAEYGLAALVAGVAAKKLGLLAIIGVAVVKFWKIGLLALVGGGALWPRLKARFAGKKNEAPPPP